MYGVLSAPLLSSSLAISSLSIVVIMKIIIIIIKVTVTGAEMGYAQRIAIHGRGVGAREIEVQLGDVDLIGHAAKVQSSFDHSGLESCILYTCSFLPLSPCSHSYIHSDIQSQHSGDNNKTVRVAFKISNN